MRHIDPDSIPHAEAHRYLLAGVAPRPIAFVGTLDAEGRPNLSPFSFFNAFGANPPVIAFSPAFRGTDGTPKHTLLNVLATREFTVSAVSHAMAEQVSLASSDFPAGVDEFVKAGFTKLPSTKIAPFGVAESPMVMECRLLQHVPLGTGPASGNLLIGEVVMFHIKESAFDGTYMSAERLDLVGRMGGALYSRTSGSAVFTLAKPTGVGVGFDALPHRVLTSEVLTGGDLAKHAGSAAIPPLDAVRAYWQGHNGGVSGSSPDEFEIELRVGNAERAVAVLADRIGGGETAGAMVHDLHRAAQCALRSNDIERAWMCVLAPEAL